MKYFKFVETKPLLSITDQPIKENDGSYAKVIQYEFLLGRVADPVFTDGLEGYDATVLIVETRAELKKQEKKAKERGYWELENDQAKRLLVAVERPKRPFDGLYAHNYIENQKVIKNMVDDVAGLNITAAPSAEAAPASPNGAQA